MSEQLARHVKNNHPKASEIRTVRDFENWCRDHLNEIVQAGILGSVGGLTSKVVSESWDAFKRIRL